VIKRIEETKEIKEDIKNTGRNRKHGMSLRNTGRGMQRNNLGIL
jgi:hypothetical protein